MTTAVEPSTIAGAQETSAVTYFATNPFGQIAPTFLVAYNTNDGLGWANSYDNGASWIQHSSTNAGAIAPIIPSVGSFGGYFSDPWVDQPSIPDSVFLSGIVRSQGSAASDAALALSSDGGNTFGTAIRITDPATGGGQPDVDAPVVAVSAQNHKAYVWWHQGAKSWLRPVSYTTSPPSMNALTPIDLSAKLKVAAPVHATLVAIPTGGVNADDTI